MNKLIYNYHMSNKKSDRVQLLLSILWFGFVSVVCTGCLLLLCAVKIRNIYTISIDSKPRGPAILLSTGPNPVKRTSTLFLEGLRGPDNHLYSMLHLVYSTHMHVRPTKTPLKHLVFSDDDDADDDNNSFVSALVMVAVSTTA